MPNDEIPLSTAKELSTEQLHVLLIQGFNMQVRKIDDMGRKVDIYIDLLEKKATREEFKGLQEHVDGKLDDHEKRLSDLANMLENGKIRLKTGLDIGRWFWVVLLAIVNLVQFFYTLGSNQ